MEKVYKRLVLVACAASLYTVISMSVQAEENLLGSSTWSSTFGSGGGRAGFMGNPHGLAGYHSSFDGVGYAANKGGISGTSIEGFNTGQTKGHKTGAVAGATEGFATASQGNGYASTGTNSNVNTSAYAQGETWTSTLGGVTTQAFSGNGNFFGKGFSQ